MTAAKPVKLQANQAGSWRNVVAFNAAHDFECAEVCDAAERIGRVLQNVTFRIVIDDGSPSPATLMRWSFDKGWREC